MSSDRSYIFESSNGNTTSPWCSAQNHRSSIIVAGALMHSSQSGCNTNMAICISGAGVSEPPTPQILLNGKASYRLSVLDSRGPGGYFNGRDCVVVAEHQIDQARTKW